MGKRKRLSLASFLFILMILLPPAGGTVGTASADSSPGIPIPGEISIYVNYRPVPTDVAPVLRSGRVFVPLRAVALSLGARVGWDPVKQEVTVTGGSGEAKDVTLKLRVGRAEALVNGKDYQSDAAPFITGGRTLVPLRLVAETLGAVVVWDAASRSVRIKMTEGAASSAPPSPGAAGGAGEGTEGALRIAGQLGGPTAAVAVQGRYAYVGVGLRLAVLDVSDPAAPREVGVTEPFGWYVEDVAVAGNTAYVAAGGGGLALVDVADPARPVVVGRYDTPGYAEALAVTGRYVYVADGLAGLRVVDAADPSRPVEVNAAYTERYVLDVAPAGGYVYLAGGGAGLLVAGIADPARPKEAASLVLPGYAYGVAVSGNTALVAGAWTGLHLVDVTDPVRPVPAGALPTPGWAFAVRSAGGIAYVAAGWGGIRIVDIADSAHPAVLGSYAPEGGHAAALVPAGPLLYVADRNAGLRVVHVGDARNPLELGGYSPLGFAADVAAAGRYAYVAAGPWGLRVVDIADPARPREVGSERSLGWAHTVAVAGDYAYVATFPHGTWNVTLHIVDIRSPERPVPIASLPIEPGVPRDMVVRGGIAYIPDEWGLQLIDVSNPQSPSRLSFIDLHTGPPAEPATVGIDVQGGLAYVAQSQGGLIVVDVADPRAPRKLAAYRPPDLVKVMSVAVSGNMAYVGDNRGLYVLDVTDPQSPKGLRRLEVSGIIDGLALDGETLVMAAGSPGVQMAGLAAPAEPVLTGAPMYVPGYALEVAVEGDRVLAASEDAGLFILERFRTDVKDDPNTDPNKENGKADSAGVHRRAAGAVPASVTASAATLTAAPTNRIKLSTASKVARLAAVTPGRTCIVASTADAGPGTLRQCLEKAAAGDRITFDPAVFLPDQPGIIRLLTKLPPLQQGQVTVDASDAGVILDGGATPAGSGGILILSDGNTVRGLQIVGFPQFGVHIGDARDNIIGGSREQGRGPLGQGNRISGNGDGVSIHGAGATGNRVFGNHIGTDLAGSSAAGNLLHGVLLNGGAAGNRVGGTEPGEGNLISGNGWSGVSLLGTGTEWNVVVGNIIGLDSAGARILDGQIESGVVINGGAAGNRIGGDAPGERNIIAGNGRTDIGLSRGAHDNVVAGNYIGTDGTGSAVLGKPVMSVSMELGAHDNQIRGNVIGTDGCCAVLISDWGTSGNAVLGNFIGVDATGSRSLGGKGDGVHVNAPFNRIGGPGPGEGNVISGNGGFGVKIGFHSIRDVLVLGNRIGTDAAGTRAVGNGQHGVVIVEGAYHSFIGGAAPGEGNLISGNRGSGVALYGPGVRYNFITGNLIGIGADGMETLPNSKGFEIQGGGQNFIQANRIAGPP
ncbi:MAG: hypothetical protein HYY09_04620 [Firmicutes bacterium]|nr:hypothetical protein [Bacillota bacterium]